MNPPISVRLPQELIDRLDSIADAAKKSRSDIIKEALESYIEEDADLQIALVRLHNETEPTLSREEISGLLQRLTYPYPVITM